MSLRVQMQIILGRRVPTAPDILLILLALGMAVSVLFIHRRAGGVPGSVMISVDNQLSGIYVLDADTSFAVRGKCGTTDVEIHEGRVRFVHSCCRQGTCVGRGWIGRPGSWLLCLPNRVMARIEGTGGADAVSE